MLGPTIDATEGGIWIAALLGALLPGGRLDAHAGWVLTRGLRMLRLFKLARTAGHGVLGAGMLEQFARFNPGLLRVLRIARILRILRILRLMRSWRGLYRICLTFLRSLPPMTNVRLLSHTVTCSPLPPSAVASRHLASPIAAAHAAAETAAHASAQGAPGAAALARRLAREQVLAHRLGPLLARDAASV